MLFAYNEEVFLIKRTLKKGKSKDSCSSQLYELQNTPEQLEGFWTDVEILHAKLDIEEYLQQK